MTVQAMAAAPAGVVPAVPVVGPPQPAVRRRLWGKSNVQTPLVGAPGVADDLDMTRTVFLITLSHSIVALSAEGFTTWLKCYLKQPSLS